uniref:RAD51 interacting motif domain-containing protein n=1 Tax=Callithrix jacchus TaxID=9483 RepID=F7HX86_CALJA
MHVCVVYVLKSHSSFLLTVKRRTTTVLRIGRTEKPVRNNDFVSATVPLNKKSKTTPKELKQDKPKQKTPKKRMAFDDKLSQRAFALALSVKELQQSPLMCRSAEKHVNSKIEAMNKSPHISNCSVASDYLDLDKITVEDDVGGVQGKRKAASKAAVQQRKILLEGSDCDSANDTEPDFASGGDSEDDSGFGESKDKDEEFSMRKSKVKEIKKKEVKVKSPVEKKEKKSKSKCNALVTSIDSAPAAVKSESHSSPKKDSLSSDVTRKPLQIRSPSAENKRPKWHHIICFLSAASGGSRNSSSPLAVVSVKSPNQSLHLGLSRLARVKPLHPNATSS